MKCIKPLRLSWTKAGNVIRIQPDGRSRIVAAHLRAATFHFHVTHTHFSGWAIPRGRFIDTNDARVPADRLITLSGKSSANFVNILFVYVHFAFSLSLRLSFCLSFHPWKLCYSRERGRQSNYLADGTSNVECSATRDT